MACSPSPREFAEVLAVEVIEMERCRKYPAAYYKEAQLQVALAAWLRSNPANFVVVEESFDGRRWKERCDIVVYESCLKPTTTPTAWIEVKKAWLGRGEGWNSKPADQVYTLLWDITKLLVQLDDGAVDACGYTVVLFYNQDQPGTRFDSIKLERLPNRSDIQDKLLRWGKAEPSSCDQAWEEVWAALGLPSELTAARLLAVYVQVLETIGEVHVEPVIGAVRDFDEEGQTLAHKLDYHAVVGRFVRT